MKHHFNFNGSECGWMEIQGEYGLSLAGIAVFAYDDFCKNNKTRINRLYPNVSNDKLEYELKMLFINTSIDVINEYVSNCYNTMYRFVMNDNA